jgi:hypothetical protein
MGGPYFLHFHVLRRLETAVDSEQDRAGRQFKSEIYSSIVSFFNNTTKTHTTIRTVYNETPLFYHILGK